MFKRILVPLDGSARAERALPVAARLAHASGGTITLVRVADTSTEFSPSAPARPTLLHTVSETDRIQAESYLQGVANAEVLANLHVKTEALLGLIAPTILSVAATQFIDLIVMCSHGFSGVTHWMLGSVAEKVAGYSETPVLVLREDGPLLTERPSNDGQSLNVLVPLDGSEYAKEAITPAANLAVALAGPDKGALQLIHVVKPVPVSVGITRTATASRTSNRQEDVRGAEQYLEETISQLRKGDTPLAHLTLTCSVENDTDVAQAIIRVAEHGQNAEDAGGNSSDVIAMTTHAYSGLSRWAMGNVTGRVLRATRMPLLIVRPH